MACMYFLYSLVLKATTAENPAINTKILQGYWEQCRDMAEFLLHVVGSDDVMTDIEDLKKVCLTDAGYYVPLDLLDDYQSSIVHMGQYVYSNTMIKRRTLAEEANMKKLDKKIAEFSALLESETLTICGFEAFELLNEAITFDLTNATYTLQICRTISECNTDIQNIIAGSIDTDKTPQILECLQKYSNALKQTFLDCHDYRAKRMKRISDLSIRYQNICTGGIEESEIMKDEKKTFNDLNSYFDSLKKFCDCNSLLSNELRRISNIDNEKSLLDAFNKWMGSFMSRGKTCGRIITLQTENYLKKFYNTEAKPNVEANITYLHQRLHDILTPLQLTMSAEIQFYITMLNNYNTKNADDCLVVTDFKTEKDAVFAEFNGILLAMRNETNMMFPESAKNLDNSNLGHLRIFGNGIQVDN